MNDNGPFEQSAISPTTDTHHASLLRPSPGAFYSAGEMDELARLDVSGSAGVNGEHGRSHYHPPPGAGARGYHAGDGGASSPGQAGGFVTCELSADPTDPLGLRIRGTAGHDGGNASGNRRFDDRLTIGNSGYVFIDTQGGRGGNGGHGGTGGPGADGYRGRNATRYSRGGDGGPGGDGGNAGQPSDGSNGGDGGNVQLHLRHDQTGLLMLVHGNMSGGDLGFAGKPANGGPGGAGGPGGSSYHWTETRSYTDSKGNRRTRTVMRSNPGGSRGPDGRPGRPSIYRARDAAAGRDGKLSIQVNGPGQAIAIYDSPFDVQLEAFDVASEYDILEPDSLISVDNLVIRNVGGMPTPPDYHIAIRVIADRWLLSRRVTLVLRRALQPGESFCFDRVGIPIRLGEDAIDDPRKRAFRLRHPISPTASLESGIGRPFRNFENSQTLRVRFPVELTPLACLRSLAPGESTRVIWALVNRSNQTFGRQWLRRSIQSRVRLIGGDLRQDLIVYFDRENREHDLLEQEDAYEPQELGPGERYLIETRIGVLDQTAEVSYQGFAVGVDLHLQRPGSSRRAEEYRGVDYRKAFIRIAEKYKRDPGSRFLLVANEKTSTRDIEGWTQLADYFGSDLDVWDVSYYGFLDLMRAVDQDESLLDQWEDMTIIIPNNYFMTPEGKTVAFDQLAKGQFLRAAADHNINFYIVGDSRTGGGEMLARSLIPVDDAKQASGIKSQKEFLRQVDRWNDYVARSQDVVGGVTSNVRELADVSLGSVHRLPVQKRTFLFQPDAKWLERHARRLQRTLSARDPNHRWIIVHRYDTGDTDTSWGFFKKRQIGSVELRRTLDTAKGSAVLYEIDSIDAIDPEFINSRANKHGIFLALKFEDKVDRFIRLVSERTFPRFSEKYIDRPLDDEEVRQIGGELVEAILVDLYNEQLAVRNCKTWGRGGIRAIMPNLNYLAERSLNYGVTLRQMQESPVTIALLYDLLGHLHHMADASKTIWDSVLIPTSFFKRSRAVSSYMRDRAEQIAKNIFGSVPPWHRRMFYSDVHDPFGFAKEKAPKWAARQVADGEIEKRRKAHKRQRLSPQSYAAAQNQQGLTYDPELLRESVRVLSGKQFDVLAQAEKQQQVQRQQTERAVRDQREELLVPLETRVVTPEQKNVAVQTGVG